MTENKAKKAQDRTEYSASDANKSNQKENAHPTGKTASEGKDPMSGPSDKNTDESDTGL